MSLAIVAHRGVDVVVHRRLKGRRGMRWWRVRAGGVVASRLAGLNDEWNHRLSAMLAARRYRLLDASWTTTST
ncbi:MAG: hypothetical protein M3Y58_08355 [Chloroflexota bacterium]|nr:hypothetical protein [Chloroflexota bacterium]